MSSTWYRASPPGGGDNLTAAEAEIIGATDRPTGAGVRVDPDPGLAGVDFQPVHRAAFKVPTLRNVALTAPYMHNGGFETLEQVVEFYDRGGAVGSGLDLPGQTLPADSLHLSRGEKRALVAFLRSLTDTTVSLPSSECTQKHTG